MDDPRKMPKEERALRRTVNLREERELRCSKKKHLGPWGLEPGTVFILPDFRRGRKYVIAYDGSLRRVKE